VDAAAGNIIGFPKSKAGIDHFVTFLSWWSLEHPGSVDDSSASVPKGGKRNPTSLPNAASAFAVAADRLHRAGSILISPCLQSIGGTAQPGKQ